MSISKQKIDREILKAEPNTLIQLFELDLSKSTRTVSNLLFHPGEIQKFEDKSITWQGRKYFPLSCSFEGASLQADGKLPRPTLTLSNHNGTISKYLKALGDLSGFKVTRKRTFLKFVDDINFPDNTNPFGTADENASFEDDIFFINTKKSENKYSVEFELVSILELEQVFLPTRQIMSNYCSWVYRSTIGCNFGHDSYHNNSPAIADSEDKKLSEKHGVTPINQGTWKRNKFYRKGDSVVITETFNQSIGEEIRETVFLCIKNNRDLDPTISPEHWEKDECSKTLSGCKCRFDPNNEGKPLPFGGFPSTEKFRMV